ncbi:putative lantibiotic modification protein [Actinosynnema mirum DSM 43827]|uniref:Putative lantibiotic modification protein n=1 Tax=Actinosynnema mirum (strain ATCC 29888 / DSM 43827 / JCM 3225 / NBRC 14064 / NCIMB 13271 / NRRL B-12336 / IMRU 3971 / 101) TaxID=446462 RepID=C6WQP4_ACTMD|nr:putative lantibiotic modification protein [Actinosynnema mirum DSM 43827]
MSGARARPDTHGVVAEAVAARGLPSPTAGASDPAGPRAHTPDELAAVAAAVHWTPPDHRWPAPAEVVPAPPPEPVEPVAADLCGREGDPPLGLLGLVFPAARAARDAAVRDVRGLGLPGLARAVGASAPVAELHQAVLRAVLTDLDRDRRAGVLLGDTPQARHEWFCARLATPAGRRAVWDRYPLLAHHVRALCGRWRRAVVELARRLAADRPRPGGLVELRLGAGDGHRGGRGVAVAVFEGGTAVYKPRPADADLLFADLVDWFGSTGPRERLSSPAVRPHDGYAWAEFVEHRPGHDRGAYHRRAGALLALLYAVLGSDMHHENVVARGDEPVLVDLETLCTPIGRVADWTVARTGLLHRGPADISGLGGGDAGPDPVTSLSPRDKGLDTAHLVWAPAVRAEPLPNRQVVAGERVAPGAHVDSVVEGFADAYDRLARARPLLLSADGPLRALGSARLRVLLRPTVAYGRLLADRAHPAHLVPGAPPWTPLDPAGDPVVACENAQLAEGDVPLFEFTPDRRDLLGGDGAVLRGALRREPRRGVEEVLERLSDADLERQAAEIRATWPG